MIFSATELDVALWWPTMTRPFLIPKFSLIFPVLRPKNQFLNSMFVKVILACFNYLKMPKYINAAESLNEKHKKDI